MEILGAPSESVPRSVKSQLSVDCKGPLASSKAYFPLNTLTNPLYLTALGGNEYRATNLWMTERMRAVYGGQVMGQALVAASMCVHDLHPSFLIHSYHCYFVGPMQASPDWEVRYMVTRVKDGTNFCSVSVGAVQRAKVCFHCLVSFQKPEAVKADLKHTGRPMPIVPHPRDHVNMESLSDADLFIVDTKRLLITEKHHWKNSFPCDMYLCMDVATAKKQLAKEPTKPKLVSPTAGMWLFAYNYQSQGFMLELSFNIPFSPKLY